MSNEETINFVHVSKDDKGYFFNTSKLGYEDIRLSKKSCEGLIIGYYKPKEEVKENE